MNSTIILASKSPRRIELMRQNGFDPIVYPSQADENLPEFISPSCAAMFLAFLKAWDVTERITDPTSVTNNTNDASYSLTLSKDQDFKVIGSDTVVVYENRIIGKPADEEDAFSTLSLLRNNSHQVITGVCIISRENGIMTKRCFHEVTDVYFNDYTDQELRSYLKTDEPYDKAGGYAIQGTFGKYIDHFDGDYNNVVGLPIDKIKREL